MAKLVAKILNFIENIGVYTMKNIILLLIGAFTLTLTSCGTFAAYSNESSQKYEDGIYSSTSSFKNRTEVDNDKQDIEQLVQQTKESPIYLFGDKKDSIIIPDNMMATLRFDKDLGTSVTIGYTNLEDIYSNYWNSPWYFNFYSSPWSYRYNPRYYGNCWGGFYGGFYNGFYGRYYDPWYYNPWYYDPWHYSYAGYYDPFYHYMHPHYYGWYGAWDPYYGAVHHRPPYGGNHNVIIGSGSSKGVYKGSRHETVSSSNKAVAGHRVSANPGSVSRKTATTSRSSFGTSRSTSARSTTAQTPTYRKPTATTPQRSTGSSSAYNRGASRSITSEPSVDRSTNNSSYYEKNTSRGHSVSTPSYNRGSSYSGGSSFQGGSNAGGYHRSSGSRR